ncbi:hypothetical protein [Gaopeijia maritima]|uniref:Curlin associated repeat-containing protein n=1 Tax=Gaopeijia maritima TaxID=3119007 RepID=A0ABU9E7R5_9BACT
MKRLALFAAFALWATPAFAQTASVSQTGGNQTAAVTQTGSASNEVYVTQFTDNTGAQESTVLQNGVSNYARVQMSQTGTGGIVPINTAFLRQVGDHNDMRQSVLAPGSNQGQHVDAEQIGNRNTGVQDIDRGYGIALDLEQRGNRNDSRQTTSSPGAGYVGGDVYQNGNDNTARQDLAGGFVQDFSVRQVGNANTGTQDMTSVGQWDFHNSAEIDQTGNDNEARQILNFLDPVTPTNSHAEVDQNGNGNYVRQASTGGNFYQRVRQDGNSNWARTDADGDENYLNARMSDGAYLRATQTGNMNSLFGTGGAGTEARILNGSSLTMTQTGDMNSSFVNMVTGGTATISQIGNSNTATVIQN